MKKLSLLCIAAFLCAVPTSGHQVPTMDEMAKDPSLFLRTLDAGLGWEIPAEPFRIAGPLYFVGTQGLGIYLFDTGKGLLLLNSGMSSSGPMIEQSIRKLGFDPSQIKIIVTGHGHIDHTGGHAYLKQLSGAKIMAMREDAGLLRDGGRSDFHYGNAREFAFEPVRNVKPLRHNEKIRLGNVELTAYRTAGHTRGAATFVTTIKDGARRFRVVFPDGTGVNPGYRLTGTPSYPGIVDDYKSTFKLLERLKPEIWLTAHNENFDLKGKSEKVASMGTAAWVDPDGYAKWVASQKAKFEAQLAAEQAAK
jgi:metallo-beta-lactamase class B